MPRDLKDIIAGVREAAGAFKPAGINIPTDELLALCEAAEKVSTLEDALQEAVWNAMGEDL